MTEATEEHLYREAEELAVRAEVMLNSAADNLRALGGFEDIAEELDLAIAHLGAPLLHLAGHP